MIKDYLPGFTLQRRAQHYLAASAIVLIIMIVLVVIDTTDATKNLNWDLKINTRNASVDDILGGVKINSTVSADETSTAKTYLKDIKNIVGDFNESISIGRIFSIHEFMDHSLGTSYCFSSHSNEDGLGALYSKKSGCPMNHMLRCMGNAAGGNISDIQAYQLNTRYLTLATDLTSDNVSDLDSKWTYVRERVDTDSLLINFSDQTYKKFNKLTCPIDDDNKKAWRKGHSTAPWGEMFSSLAFTICEIPLVYFTASMWKPYVALLALVSLVLWCAALGYNQTRTDAIVKPLLASSDGITIKTSLKDGAGVSVLLIILIVIGFFRIVGLVVYVYLDSHNEEKRALDEQDRIYLSGWAYRKKRLLRMWDLD